MFVLASGAAPPTLDVPVRSDSVRALRARYVSAAIGHATSVVVDHASGSQVWDIDGRRYLDFAAGIGTLNVGHAHPRIVAAIQRQAERFTHVAFGVALYEPYIRLAQVLSEITPGAFPKKTLFANSGAEAVENAVKIARAATGRPLVVSFTNAFHGRTLLAMGLTAKDHPYKAGFGPFPGDVLRAPQPYLYRPLHPSDEVAGCLDALERLLREHPDARAASRGLILIRAGLYDNVIRLLPPLVASDSEIDQGLDILAAALADVTRASA
jgi:4-aminobutyrate aminotransferase / (S)-3-amino-2-methylpropionate transaminase / 5-aminovalerate transaminase